MEGGVQGVEKLGRGRRTSDEENVDSEEKEQCFERAG